jgi:hypothetical protein
LKKQNFKQMNRFSLFVSLIAAIMLLSSCDKISEPFIETPSNIDTVSKVRKVLLEDFTGHRCVNCPQAHEIIKALEQTYGDRLVSIGIHAGVFSFPVSPTYSYNFRTPEGNSLETGFGISTYPSGMVNRKKVSGTMILDKDGWGAAVAGIINEPAEAFITLSNTYNPSTRSLDVTVNTEILSNLDGIYRLCVYLTEDNIIKPQMNNDPTIGTIPDILNYVHSHVLRKAINSTWGDTLSTDPVAGQTISLSYTNFILDSEWKEDDCKVIAFIYRDDDADGNRYEVVQAEKKKVK